jgi:hypothetical protein
MVMSKKTLAAREKCFKKLLEAKATRSQEDAHVMADEALCAFIEDLGCGDLIEVFNEIPKWYA